ncbi:Putative Mg2+ transporter protein, CorA-like/Zinc transport protein ZntB [Septoria linicola]|uniref:Mg2+ transporter protein, CorA-like/Zinc transport protein ZntB n=1 Tax=Septoria linicola TaxID=215465 RepID=A0A9Q9AL84_9PEZI|nr:putative Mg2+ transporter protein, CorA-like/Zinc transport protein ZntB [Septoria linicola]USW49028.1 Putative Mg2+ transporter protein, CorA-like/Zinc transport protein ZntB [Septoria linicola]
MPKEAHFHDASEASQGRSYEADPRWQKKPITPAQILVHDVRLETLRADRGPLLECHERSAHTLVPDTAAFTPSASLIRVGEATDNPIEKQKFTNLEEDYGWVRYLRSQKFQQHALDDEDSTKCRWVHCSSKFPEYIRGFLWAMSDDITTVADSMRMLDIVMQRQTRFSKHGKSFQPFAQTLRSTPTGVSAGDVYPMLISVPFLDWTMQGPAPPLRFQVDKREGFLSARSSAHIVRSILQYYYRLEDTQDREDLQVFSRHKPWRTNRELDLKVRQWYGQYPTALNVDELWILAIDAEHIVTFSSNQTWKSRWPPFQFSSRVVDVSFRGIRNNYFRSDEKREYTAMTHAIASLSGAVGMLHRNFWPDLYMCLSDRYAGHLGHLQYRLHRAPSTKLVMDLIACQEELNIVIQITEQQLETIGDLQATLETADGCEVQRQTSPVSRNTRDYDEYDEHDLTKRTVSRRSTYRQLSTSVLSDPVAQLLDNLERELADLRDLRDNTDRLVTRTIQLVNIRLEDHGKAILVFTVVTIVFLPLNFVSSFFGMNFSDIRDMETTQWLFWAVAVAVTISVVASSVFLAFSGGPLLEKFHMWRNTRRDTRMFTTSSLRHTAGSHAHSGFRVHGTDKAYGGASMQAG